VAPFAMINRLQLSVMSMFYGLTVFVGAFLLFQVQPMIGKYILPWYGSTPGVWTTCLLFFQVMLLVGYVYAHLIIVRLSPRMQSITHISVLLVATALLPITPSGDWGLKGAENDPTLQILLLLLISVGAPYLVLSSTGPLLQGWYARVFPDRSPYRLYALSNAGSMLALVTYPFIFERYFPLRHQTAGWSLAFAIFVLLCAFCAWRALRILQEAGRDEAGGSPVSEEANPPRQALVGLWILLAACGSGLLMATTNRFCMDVAVIPLLWILPLAIYLLSFVICFDHDRWYVRPLFFGLLPISIAMACISLSGGVNQSIRTQILTGSFTLFICLMCCHGELARLRPHSRHLTLYYLAIALGGAVGGIFVAIIAPAVFSAVWEYHLLLAGCYFLVLSIIIPTTAKWLKSLDHPRRPRLGPILSGSTLLLAGLTVIVLHFLPDAWLPLTSEGNAVKRVNLLLWVAGGLILLISSMLILHLSSFRASQGLDKGKSMLGKRLITVLFLTVYLCAIPILGALGWDICRGRDGLIVRKRNFFGTLKIVEDGSGMFQTSVLKHGRIMHGFQYMNPALHPLPTSYYGPRSGLGLAIRRHPERRTPGRQFRVGVIGLGVGTTAAYANASILETPERASYIALRPRKIGDFFALYEINPLIERWSEEYFTYLGDARERGATVELFPGDARKVMERQLERGQPQHFDVLAVDAFSSDAVPLHLLTKECFKVYWNHLYDDGILAVHVSSRHIKLTPVVCRLAEDMGKTFLLVNSEEDVPVGVNLCSWVVVTNNREFLHDPEVIASKTLTPRTGPLWTDDYSSIIPLLRK
jgi:hypothetical protein